MISKSVTTSAGLNSRTILRAADARALLGAAAASISQAPQRRLRLAEPSAPGRRALLAEFIDPCRASSGASLV